MRKVLQLTEQAISMLPKPNSGAPMTKRTALRQKDIVRFLDSLYEDNLHTMRVLSLSNATLGS